MLTLQIHNNNVLHECITWDARRTAAYSDEWQCHAADGRDACTSASAACSAAADNCKGRGTAGFASY